MSIQDENNILYGGLGPLNYNDSTDSLGQLIIKRLTRYENKVILIDGATGAEFTGAQVRDRSVRVADLLIRGLNVTHDDRIGICGENRTEFASVELGTLIAGATFAPLNVTYTEREMDHLLKLSKPKVLFASPSTIDRIVKVAKENLFIQKIIVFGNTSSHSNVQDFHSFFNNQSITTDLKEFKCSPQNITTKTALILCSSGTTGVPKGVQLSEKNVMIGIAQHYDNFSDNDYKLLNNEFITIGVIPWFHAYGCITLIGMCISGHQLLFYQKFEEISFLSGIEKYKVNVANLVPPLLVFLAKNPIVSKYDLSSLKLIYSGAAPLSRELEDAVKDRIKVHSIRQGYGMTEGSLSFTAQTETRNKPGSVGMLRKGFWARIIDPETGRNLGPYEQGELCFKSEANMLGYIDNVEATRDTIDSDGWLHTGDVGYYDTDGEFFIVDRLKELIKCKGFQVPPAEIEGILLKHQAIADAAVIGIPDDVAGELPLAFIVKQKGATVTEKEIISFVAGLTSPAKRLHGGVKFIDSIPKSPTGKILRKNLRQMVAEQNTSKL